MMTKNVDLETGPRSRSPLIYCGIVWSILVSISGIYLFSDFLYCFTDPWHWNRLIYRVPHLLPILIQIIGYSVISIAMYLGKDWSPLSFIVLSMILFLWGLLTPVTGICHYAGPGLVTISIGSWFFNRPEILRYFGTKDVRQRWITQKILGIQKDFAFGIIIVVISLTYDVLDIVRVGLSRYLQMEISRITLVLTWYFSRW